MANIINRPGASIDLLDMDGSASSWMIVVAFLRNPSPFFRSALAFAQRADHYEEASLGGTPIHIACYAKSPKSATRAYELLRYVVGWKGTYVYAHGDGNMGPYGAYAVQETLGCYLMALRCNDHRAHCHRVIRSPFISDSSSDQRPTDRGPGIDCYLFPCQLLEPYAELGTWHPSTPTALIQARAVERRIDWCPFFDQNAFMRIGDVADGGK